MKEKAFMAKAIRRVIPVLLKNGGDLKRREALEWTLRLLKKENKVTVEIKQVIYVCIQRGDAEFLPKILELIPKVSKIKYGEEAIDNFIKRGWLTGVVAIAKVLSRKLTDDELTALAKAVIAGRILSVNDEIAEICELFESREKRADVLEYAIGKLEDEADARALAKLLPRDRRSAIDKLIRHVLAKYPWMVWEAISLNELLPEGEEKSWYWSKIRERCINKGSLEAAEKVSQKIKEALSVDELHKIFSACKKKGHYEEAILVCKKLGRVFAEEDKLEVVRNLFDKKDYSSSEKATRELFPNDEGKTRTALLTILVSKLIKEGCEDDLEEAFELIERGYPKSATACDLRRIIAAWLKKLEKGEYIYMPKLEKVMAKLESMDK